MTPNRCQNLRTKKLFTGTDPEEASWKGNQSKRRLLISGVISPKALRVWTTGQPIPLLASRSGELLQGVIHDTHTSSVELDAGGIPGIHFRWPLISALTRFLRLLVVRVNTGITQAHRVQIQP